ncbi:MAG TPA: deoxyhypusine synthase family protein [Myxococcota bacterium]
MPEARDESRYGRGTDDGLAPLTPLDPAATDSVDALVRAMSQTAFGGRCLGEAADVLEAMVRDSDCYRVLTVSGAMTVAKQGLVMCEMIERGWVQAVVATGALMTHGLSEGTGKLHFKHDPSMRDEDLYDKGYNRVYDTIELEKNLDDVERLLQQSLEDVPRDVVLSSRLICERLGLQLKKMGAERAILLSALEHKVPVFVPAFTDSELGLDLAIHNHLRAQKGAHTFSFDPFRDLDDFAEGIRQHDTLGIFTIGGGVPRNWAQQVGPYLEILRSRLGSHEPVRRYKYAVRICPEPVHWGGLSGCTYSEGISWGKFVPPEEGGRFAEVFADATIAWPLVVRAVIERLDRDA